MALELPYTAFSNTTVTVYNLSTRDAYGAPTWATGVSYDARVVESQHMVTDPSGQEVVATHRIWILSTKTTHSNITVESSVNISGDSTATRRKIVNIERPPDRSGLHHTVLELGSG